ncbi:MAG: homocysteine S-methyltransferase family protein [Oscillospiraceae bacterium]|jgi:5-methyltetrahydrofolate--homocysteine methyltransferase|nr:homocysteine S-methyltransferase family protein [Oscillospiraceae bacterium]
MRFDISEMTRRGVFIADGGTGTVLQSRGLGSEGTETWCLTRPGEVLRLHGEYLAAGAMWLKTNTFGANRVKYPRGGAYDLRELIFAAVGLAKRAVEDAGRAGEVPVVLSVGPTGRLLEPYGDLPFEEAVGIFGEAIAWGAGAGADAVLAETFSDTREARAAVVAAKEGAPGLPVFCSLTFEENGRLLSGAAPEAAVAILEGLGVQAVGVNCGAGPARAMRVLPGIAAAAHVPVIANPNAGLPRVENGRAVFDLPPEEFAAQCERLAALGASILGGCCGTTPAHIEALGARLKGKKTPLPQGKTEEVIAGSREVALLSECGVDELEEYDPEEPGFGPVKITCGDPVELEALLREYDGKALVAAPGWAQALVGKYGGVLVKR